MTSIVLAGGRGTRLGKDKLQVLVGGRPLLQRVIDSLSLISERILVVTAHGQKHPVIQAAQTEVSLVEDIYLGKGALGGIYTGLSASASQYALVVAADMPFLNPVLLQYLVGLTPGFDAVVPRIDGLIQPLHAVYSRDCLPAIQEHLDRDRLQVRAVMERVGVRYVEKAEIKRLDRMHLSHFNINTPDDLTKAQEIAAGIESH